MLMHSSCIVPGVLRMGFRWTKDLPRYALLYAVYLAHTVDS